MYHLTDDPNFSLNPDFEPEDNAISIHDRSGIKGIYLTKDVERWVNGHGYRRPYVAEISVSHEAVEGDSMSRWGGEHFIHAHDFDKLQIERVIPLDAYCREEFGDYGWLESEKGVTFDTGEEIPRSYSSVRPFANYRYDGSQ